VQALVDVLRAVLGDMGRPYDMVYTVMAFVAFMLVFVMVLSAIIRVIDRR